MHNPFSLDNPALTRELRTRLRGARAFALLFFYLMALAATLFITYLIWWQENRNNLGGSFLIGRTFFTMLFIVQALLVAVITPSLTAGGITIEKEQRTLEMLKTSLLPPSAIAWGKLLAATAFVGLMIISALPLFSLGFLLGGVAPDEVLISCGLLLTNAFVYGAIGLGCSSLSKSTTSATVETYAALAILFFVTLPFALPAFGPLFGGSKGGMGLVGLNPIGAMSAAGGRETYFGLTLPAWAISGGLNILLGSIFAIAAGHRIEYPRSDRSGLLRLLTAVYVALLALGVYHFALIGARSIVGGAGGSAAGLSSLLALLVLIPAFAPGDGLPRPGGIWTLFNPMRLRRGEAPSGLLYILLLCLLAMLLLFLTVRFDAAQSKITFLQIARFAGLLLAVAWGFGCFALFLSAGLKQRVSAGAITFVAMLGFYLIPATASEWGDAAPGAIAHYLGYLSPLIASSVIFTPVTMTKMADAPTITTLLSLTAGIVFFAAATRQNR